MSEIHFGLCVPSSCSYKEVESVLLQKLEEFIDDPAVLFEVEVRENMCQVKRADWALDLGFFISVYIKFVYLRMKMFPRNHQKYFVYFKVFVSGRYYFIMFCANAKTLSEES